MTFILLHSSRVSIPTASTYMIIQLSLPDTFKPAVNAVLTNSNQGSNIFSEYNSKNDQGEH